MSFQAEMTGNLFHPSRRAFRFTVLFLAGLLTYGSYFAYDSIGALAPKLIRAWSTSQAGIGALYTIYSVAAILSVFLGGMLTDRIGTRRGLTLSVLWYSTVAVLTSLATGLRSFCAFRFLLGAGEAANWPGATKAVSEWFPRRERGWAVALFDSGSSIGAAAAPALVLFLLGHFGGWRPAFVVTGLLGFLWVIAWRWNYHPPETHPSLSEGERAMILADRAAEHAEAPHEEGARLPHWGELLRLPQTWGVIAARGLTDPVWFMIADWFAIYLAAKGFNLEETAAGFWVPFLAADLGNFFGGGFSSHLIRRGWPVGRARKALVVGGAFGVLALVPAAFLSDFRSLVACFAIATFSYAAMSTMALALPADLFQSRAVASVSGMSGTGAGLGTIGATYLIGLVADRFSFTPILLVSSVIPLLAAFCVLALVRNTAASGRGLVKVI